MSGKRAGTTIGRNQHDHFLDKEGLHRLIATIKEGGMRFLLTHLLHREVAPQGGRLSVQQSGSSEQKCTILRLLRQSRLHSSGRVAAAKDRALQQKRMRYSSKKKKSAEKVDRTPDLMIFSHTLSQLSYLGFWLPFSTTLHQRRRWKRGSGSIDRSGVKKK